MSTKTLVQRLRARRLPPPSACRAIRKKAGATQADLAAELGVDRATVSRWESGTRYPRGDRAALYGRLLSRMTS